MVLLGETLRKYVWGLIRAGGARGQCWVLGFRGERAGRAGELWGGLSGPKGPSQRGVLAEDAGFSQGIKPCYPCLGANIKGFAGKAHQITQRRGGNKSAAFSVVCGLMLFSRYLEN